MEKLRNYHQEFEKELKHFPKDTKETADEELRRIQAYLGFTNSTFGNMNMMETLITIGVMVEGVLVDKGF